MTTNGRKWKGTKEPLDKGERVEWKSWIKAFIQKLFEYFENEDHGILSHHFMANRWGNDTEKTKPVCRGDCGSQQTVENS